MELYAGIDLHSSNSVLAVIDATGAQLRSKRLANDLPTVLAELEPYRDTLVGVAVESTYNWYWLVDGLMDHGHRVRLVNTTAIPQYDGLKHGDDRTDARHLAELMRLGLLPEGYIYPRPARATRDLLRRRAGLVRQSTQVILSMQSTYARITGRPISGQDLLKLKPKELMSALSDPTVCCGVLAQLRVWQVLREQIDRIEGWVRQDIHPKSDLARLQSTPGIGSILGMTILLETGDINRFGSVGEYASYCRMVASVRLSNGKRKVGATPSAATVTCAGPSSRRPTSRSATASRSAAGTTASTPSAIAWWRSRPSPTSWPAPCSTCCATTSRSSWTGRSDD